MVGLGYVGLPLAVEFADKGFITRGIDLNKERVLRLNAGHNYNQDLPDDQVEKVVHFILHGDHLKWEEGDQVSIEPIISIVLNDGI